MINRLQSPSVLVTAAAISTRDPLHCPLCGGTLRLDSWWHSPHWLCTSNHSYSNLRVLDEELQAFARRVDAPSRELQIAVD